MSSQIDSCQSFFIIEKDNQILPVAQAKYSAMFLDLFLSLMPQIKTCWVTFEVYQNATTFLVTTPVQHHQLVTGLQQHSSVSTFSLFSEHNSQTDTIKVSSFCSSLWWLPMSHKVNANPCTANACHHLQFISQCPLPRSLQPHWLLQFLRHPGRFLMQGSTPAVPSTWMLFSKKPPSHFPQVLTQMLPHRGDSQTTIVSPLATPHATSPFSLSFLQGSFTFQHTELYFTTSFTYGLSPHRKCTNSTKAGSFLSHSWL